MSFLTCDNKETLTAEQLLKSCFGKDATGKVFLRTIKVDVTTGGNNNDAFDCNTAGTITLDMLIKSAVQIDGDGKAALYVGESSF